MKFEVGDYALYKNEIVKILRYRKINGQDRFKISNNDGWFLLSNFVEIDINEESYWKLFDFLKGKSEDETIYTILCILIPKGNSWIGNDLGFEYVNIESYQEFRTLCKNKSILSIANPKILPISKS